MMNRVISLHLPHLSLPSHGIRKTSVSLLLGAPPSRTNAVTLWVLSATTQPPMNRTLYLIAKLQMRSTSFTRDTIRLMLVGPLTLPSRATTSPLSRLLGSSVPLMPPIPARGHPLPCQERTSESLISTRRANSNSSPTLFLRPS